MKKIAFILLVIAVCLIVGMNGYNRGKARTHSKVSAVEHQGIGSHGLKWICNKCEAKSDNPKICIYCGEIGRLRRR